MPQKAQELMTYLLLAAIPAFGSGFVEDLTKESEHSYPTALHHRFWGAGLRADRVYRFSIRACGAWTGCWALA